MTTALYFLLVACAVAVIVAVTKLIEWRGDRYHPTREERAFDALIVLAMRADLDLTDPDRLPELSEKERAALDSLPEDFVERLWDINTGETPSVPRMSHLDDADPMSR